MAVVCTFERIGRTKSPAPLILDNPPMETARLLRDGQPIIRTLGVDWPAVSDLVLKYAQPYLRSSGAQITMTAQDDDTNRWQGHIIVGMVSLAGRFNVQVIP